LTVERACLSTGEMRAFRVSALLVPLSSVALLACFGSTNNELPPENGGGLPDASSITDATVPDGASTPTPDASPGDAGAPPVDAGTTPDAAEAATLPPVVTVLVESAGGPESGKTIVFSDSTGALIATDTTNALGVAAEAVPANSQVTAILGTADAPNLVTVTGVQPGDQLTAIDTSQSEAVVDFTLPPTPADAGQVGAYEVHAGVCSSFDDGNTGVLDLPSGCVGPQGTFPFLALADGESGPIAFLAQNNNALAADGGTTTLSPSGTWVQTMGTEDVTVNDLPSDSFPIISYSEVASGLPFPSSDEEPETMDAGFESTFSTHPGYPDFVQTEVQTQTAGDGNSVMVLAVANRAPAPTIASPSGSVSFDGSEFLPTITDASIDTTDPIRPSVTWTPSSPLTAAVATFVSIQWNDQTDAGDELSGTWTLVVPASQTTVRLPALPDAASASGPSVTSTWPVTNPTVAAAGGPGFISYAAVRATAAIVGAALNPFNEPVIPPLLADGRAQLSMFVRQNPSE
jgi:hypothetical protein